MLPKHSIFTGRIGVVLGLSIGFALARVPASAVPIPGPDNFGYIGTEIDYGLRDLTHSRSATLLSLNDDQIIADIPIGFEFDFYGWRYDKVAISSNGYLAFGPSVDVSKHATEIPSSEGPDNFIAGLYRDLLFLTPEQREMFGGTGDVYYEARGPRNSREFVIGFYDVAESFGLAQYTFEMILHEGSQNVEFQIDDAPRGNESFSIGIENRGSDDGLSVVSNAGSIDELDQCGGACDLTTLDDVGFLFTHPTGILGPRPPEPGGIPVDSKNDPANFLEVRQVNDTVRWEVGVTTEVTSHGEGGVDDFAYRGPAFTVYEGGFVDPHQDDAYDRANIVALALPGQEGEAVQSSSPDVGVNFFRNGRVSSLPSGATLVEGDRYRMNNGMDAQLSYYFSDTAAIVRTVVEFTNRTDRDIANAVVNFVNPMGTDGETWVIATANNPNGGDPTRFTDPLRDPPNDTFRYGDRWIVTDERVLAQSDGQGDPATTHVYFGPDGHNAGPEGGVPQLFFNGAPGEPDDIYTLLSVDLPRDETTTLMFFSELTRTHAEALDGVDKYRDLDRLREVGLLEGIPVGTMIYNWDLVRTAPLHAGDADEDFDFDQLDLVQVQIAAKYLTDELATWGEGDWDSAPGGEPGSPPAGDGVFDQVDIIRALTGGVYRTGPYAELSPVGDGMAAVPEPSSIWLAALAFPGLLLWVWPRRRRTR